MRRVLTFFIALAAICLGIQAQPRMQVRLTNGSVLNLYTSQIEEVTFDDYTEDAPTENDPGQNSVTGDATDIGYDCATVTGYANNIMDSEANDLKIGIIYCTEGTPNRSNGTQRTVSRSSLDGDGKYTVTLTGLTDGTTYYYRSFVYQSGLWFYGTVKSFRTKLADNVTFMTGSATTITCFSAKVAANVLIDGIKPTSSYTYGICYGTEPEPTTEVRATGTDAAGGYTVQLRALTGNTMYYYRPYAIVGGKTCYGETSSFLTLPDNVVKTGEADDDMNVRSQLTISGGAFSKLEVGVCWTTEDKLPTVDDTKAAANELDDENYYTVWIHDHREGTYRYRYRAYVLIDGSVHYGEVKEQFYEGKYVGHAIDLGLSVKWACCNVGAENPEDYGDYFAWGETKSKTDYSWDTYFDTVNGSSSNFSKYATGEKTVLDSEDDAATVNWGGSWRMPTLAEQQELRKNCVWTWTTRNGINGYEVKSKVNDNSIFLPAAGCRWDSDLSDAGSRGYYWSSSLDPGVDYHACSLYFYSDYWYWLSYYRSDGHSVRAVCP